MVLDWASARVCISCGCHITSYHKPGLKTQGFILWPFWRPEVQNQCYWADMRLSAGPRSLQRLCQRSRPSPPPASPAASTRSLAAGSLWSVPSAVMLPPSLPCQMSLCISPVRTLVIPLRAYLDNLGSSPHPRILYLVTSAKPFFPYKEGDPYTFQRRGHDTFAGLCVQLATPHFWQLGRLTERARDFRFYPPRVILPWN